jgi:hypothetical protein
MSIGNSWIDRDKLKDFYIIQGLSTFTIGRLFNVSAPTVRYWLKKWCFYIRNKSEAQLGDNNPGWVGGPKNRFRYQMRKFAVDYKMNKGCFICGYRSCSAALDFHHIDPTQKEFGITRQSINDTEVLKKEIEKCIVVCANCHNEIHFKPPYRLDRTIRETWNYISNLKSSIGCYKCSYNKISGLEFHHINKTDKLFTIGRAKSLSKPLNVIMDEIKKCRVICSNCHREEEAKTTMYKDNSTVVFNSDKEEHKEINIKDLEGIKKNLKEHYKTRSKRKRIAWNKGLNISDPRIKKSSERRKENQEYKTYKFIKDGIIVEIKNFVQYCEDNRLSRGILWDIWKYGYRTVTWKNKNGKTSEHKYDSHKGYKKYIEVEL